ncbi:glycosyl hydrolase family 85-domain-containing protein [Blastocladiella britannica]|nr:glycosyl hydrolase family 85-domain-containing protein [Blastocladiella britannica]
MLYYTSTADLLAWQHPSLTPAAHIPVIPLPRRAVASLTMPRRRLLVCHDMMGGYTAEDSEPNGPAPHSTGLSSEARVAHAFTLHAMSLVDVFVYFSHHRVSLVPPQWANLAHRCGVRVLGTIIFEWKEAVPDLLAFMYGADQGAQWLADARWRAASGVPVPKMPPIDYAACDRLVDVAETYRMSGYLLNIETALPGGPAQARDLAHLTGYLTVQLNQRLGPRAQLIWYDSVTHDGALAWQDGLSAAHNRAYFDAANGLFANYTWSPTRAAASAHEAGPRVRDVYTGIDVFGRNMFGGGGVAVMDAQRVVSWTGASTALFAPGWVYEEEEPETAENRARVGWWDREARMWEPLASEFGLPDNGSSSCSGVRQGHVPDDQDGWATWFGSAAGSRFFVNGELVSSAAWVNHSLQSPLPPPNADTWVLDRTAPAFFGATSLRLLAGATLEFPFAATDLHADTDMWVVYSQDDQLDGDDDQPILDITVTAYARSGTGGIVRTVTRVAPRSARPVHADWHVHSIRLPVSTDPLRNRPVPHTLVSVTIANVSGRPVRLGQLAFAVRSRVANAPALSTTLAALVAHPDGSAARVAADRKRLPPGCPMLLVVPPPTAKIGKVARVLVQGDPWDNVHAGETIDMAEREAHGDLDAVRVEWWPYWRGIIVAT